MWGDHPVREGRAFSAGHDLDSPDELADREKRVEGLSGFSVTGLSRDLYVDMHLRWRDLPKPTIAMVMVIVSLAVDDCGRHGFHLCLRGCSP